MEVNGWQLFQHPLFRHQYEKLLELAEKIEAQQPGGYGGNKTVKLLAKVSDLILTEIPGDPGHDKFNQGNTLGKDYRHWKRAKFGRFRLFFLYAMKRKTDGTEEKIIVYAWVNDENTLRKDGDKNDPYLLFVKGLKRGQPPESFDALLKESIELKSAERTEAEAEQEE